MGTHIAFKPGIALRAFGSLLPQVEREVPFGADSSESLFHALDGRELRAAGDHWKIEVFSVCELDGERYVQLALNGLERHMLTLRVALDADIRGLIPRLLSWLRAPSFGEVLRLN